jgi:hypothetical protein
MKKQHEKSHKEKVHHNEHHKKKGFPIFLIVVSLILLTPILVLGYLGLVPGVSDLMGSNKPRDLGVRTTEQDLITASAKVGRVRESLPSADSPKESMKFSGSHKVDAAFTSEEVTKTMQSRNYKYNPLSDDFQAKFNSDGSLEMSGTVLMDNLKDYGEASNVRKDQADMILEKTNFLKTNPAFYVKAKYSVENNKVNLDLKEAVLGRMPVPVDALPIDKIERFAEERINNITGLYVESLRVEDGKLKFKGTYPDKTSYLGK